MLLVDKHGADPIVTTKGAVESHIQHRMLHSEQSSFFHADLLGVVGTLVWRSETTCRSQFLPSKIWVLGFIILGPE